MADSGFKAIETRYDRHLFRSRREARQAVFFNMLRIPYEYEPEEYSLEGVPYLPDFYLPEQGCFVEVKGQYPTALEKRKVKLLSLYTHKRAFICYGEIVPPGCSILGSFGYFPPSVTKQQADETRPVEHITVQPHILLTLQKLHDGGYDLGVEEDGLCSLISYLHCHQEVDSEDEKHTFEELLQDIEFHYQDGQQGLNLLRQHHQELVTLLRQERHAPSYVGFNPQKFSVDCYWYQCEQCEHLDFRDWGNAHCPRCGGSMTPTSPRLLEAYEAASSARFEYGSKGRN